MSKYDPYISECNIFFASHPGENVYDMKIPPNFSADSFRNVARKRGYYWSVHPDGERVVVVKK